MKILLSFTLIFFLSITCYCQCNNQSLTVFKSLVKDSHIEEYQKMEKIFFSDKNKTGIKITIVPALTSPSSISIHDANGSKEIMIKILSNRTDSDYDCHDPKGDCNIYTHKVNISSEEYEILLAYFNTHINDASTIIPKGLVFDGTDILLANSNHKSVLTSIHTDECILKLESNIQKLRSLVIMKRKKKISTFIRTLVE